MKREILFRGMRMDGKGWAYGYYTHNWYWHGTGLDKRNVEEHWIWDDHGGKVDVKPETVGQFTGLHDKNGMKIFEGDLVDIMGLERVVRYSDDYATFTLNRLETDQIQVYNINAKVIAVTGNIHTP